MAGREDFDIDSGATFQFQINYTQDDGDPVDLTGYTAKMQIRRGTKEIGRPLFELSTTISSSGTGIIINAPDGTIAIKIVDEDTAKFTFGQAVYDLVIISPEGDVERLCQGKLTVDPGVTIV